MDHSTVSSSPSSSTVFDFGRNAVPGRCSPVPEDFKEGDWICPCPPDDPRASGGTGCVRTAKRRGPARPGQAVDAMRGTSGEVVDQTAVGGPSACKERNSSSSKGRWYLDRRYFRVDADTYKHLLYHGRLDGHSTSERR